MKVSTTFLQQPVWFTFTMVWHNRVFPSLLLLQNTHMLPLHQFFVKYECNEDTFRSVKNSWRFITEMFCNSVSVSIQVSKERLQFTSIIEISLFSWSFLKWHPPSRSKVFILASVPSSCIEYTTTALYENPYSLLKSEGSSSLWRREEILNLVSCPLDSTRISSVILHEMYTHPTCQTLEKYNTGNQCPYTINL